MPVELPGDGHLGRGVAGPQGRTARHIVSPARFEGVDGTALCAWEVRLADEVEGAAEEGAEGKVGGEAGAGEAEGGRTEGGRAGGGRRPVALLVHGNGLNGRCWLPAAQQLARRGWICVALDMRGHGSSGRSPGSDYSWSLLARDATSVCTDLVHRYPGAPLIGVGHSAGASALLMADAYEPGKLCCIWAYEPIMAVPGTDLRQVRSPELAARARRRRSRFATRQEALEHFKGRGAFAEFSAESLDAYVAGGLVPVADLGFELACRPEDEALIYEAAGAHDAWPSLDRLSAPLRLVGGRASPAVPPEDLKVMAARAGVPDPLVLDGLGHFGPFAQPALVALDIEDFARRCGCAGHEMLQNSHMPRVAS